MNNNNKTTGVEVDLDFSQLIGKYSGKISSDEVEGFLNNVLHKVSDAIYNSWRDVASQSLHATRAQYIAGLQRPVVSGNTATIVLIGVLPNMLESGAQSFDMKLGFKSSKKVHIKKHGGGWYLTIPFRHATSNALAEDAGFANSLPEDIYNIVESLKPTIVSKGKVVVYGGSLKESQMPKQYQDVRHVHEAVKAGGVKYGAYTHKSNIFDNMIKVQNKYANATQNKYMTFRRVSDKSDPNSWIFRGLIARAFAEKAVNDTNIDSVVLNSADRFLTEQGF